MEKGLQTKIKIQYRIGAYLCLSLLLIGVLNVGGDLSQASSSTLYVDDDNTTGPWQGTQAFPYQYIQQAVDVAEDDFTIMVKAGVYTENVVIRKNIHLIGENRETTIINGANVDHTIYIQGTISESVTVTISSFTIKNAGGTGNDNIAYAYGINAEISNNNILSSQQSDGIQLSDSRHIDIINNNIKDNEGAGVALIRSEFCSISENIIQENQKGIYLYDASSRNDVFDNTISRNSQYGIQIQISYFPSENNLFYYNDLTENGEGNAYDAATNQWHHNKQGNFWDDYQGEDENSDSIGDESYEISGGSNIDSYPLGYFAESTQDHYGNILPIAYKPVLSPTEAPYGSIISFSGQGKDSDGQITGYSWRSNIDGILSSEQQFTTTDLSKNTHIIYFKVKDDNGKWSSETTGSVTISSAVNKEPSAYIEYVTPNPAEVQEPISFSGYGTDSDGTIVDWRWVSDIDGNLSSKARFEKTSFSAGTHAIHFYVKDDDGEWSTKATKSLTILQNGENQLPVADPGGPYFGMIDDPIILNGTQSYDPDGTIKKYFWNFNNGESGTGGIVQTTYDTSGNYTITLTVTDSAGAIHTDTSYVVISEQTEDSLFGEGFSLLQVELTFPLVLLFVLLGVSGAIILFFLVMKRRE